MVLVLVLVTGWGAGVGGAVVLAPFFLFGIIRVAAKFNSGKLLKQSWEKLALVITVATLCIFTGGHSK